MSDLVARAREALEDRVQDAQAENVRLRLLKRARELETENAVLRKELGE